MTASICSFVTAPGRKIIGMAVGSVDQHLVKENETPKAPGMKYKHYSPDTRVLMVRDSDWSIAVQWAKNKKIRAGVIASPEIADQVRTDTAAVYMYNDKHCIILKECGNNQLIIFQNNFAQLLFSSDSYKHSPIQFLDILVQKSNLIQVLVHLILLDLQTIL